MFSILLALFAFVFILNSTYFIFEILKSTNSYSQKSQFEEKYIIYSPIIKLYVPYFIMVGLDIKVVLSLRESKKRALNGRGVQNGMNKFTISTILIDLIYLIFKSIKVIFQSYTFIIVIRSEYFGNTNVNFIFILFYKISDDIAFSHSAFIIFIFVIFNRLFRKEIICFFRLDKLSFFLAYLMTSSTLQN